MNSLERTCPLPSPLSSGCLAVVLAIRQSHQSMNQWTILRASSFRLR